MKEKFRTFPDAESMIQFLIKRSTMKKGFRDAYNRIYVFKENGILVKYFPETYKEIDAIRFTYSIVEENKKFYITTESNAIGNATRYQIDISENEANIMDIIGEAWKSGFTGAIFLLFTPTDPIQKDAILLRQ